MSKLYDEAFLPIVQSLNEYGGNHTSHLIKRAVLDAVQLGAASDQSLALLYAKLSGSLAKWKGVQDHVTFSAFFEAYYEGMALTLARAHDHASLHVGERGRAAPSTRGRVWVGVFSFAARCAQADGRPCIGRSA